MKTKKHNLLCNFASLFLTSNLMQFGKVNLLFFKKHLGRNSLNHFRMCDSIFILEDKPLLIKDSPASTKSH